METVKRVLVIEPYRGETEANKTGGKTDYTDRVLQSELTDVADSDFKVMYKHIWTVGF
jgi:hypothetical protein